MRLTSRMKRVARVLGLGLGLFALLCLGAYLLIESGEVVTLRTTDDHGTQFRTRLWVVDHQGHPWVGTTDPSTTRWVPRLRAHPEIELERAGLRECRNAVFEEDADTRAEVNRRFDTKYRVPIYGSQFLKIIGGARRDTAEQVLIRLEPCRPGR